MTDTPSGAVLRAALNELTDFLENGIGWFDGVSHEFAQMRQADRERLDDLTDAGLAALAATEAPEDDADIQQAGAGGPDFTPKEWPEARPETDLDVAAVLSEADSLVSLAHDAIYAEPYDRNAANEAIWRVHAVLRGTLQRYFPRFLAAYRDERP